MRAGPGQGEREEVGAADHADLVLAVLGRLLAGDGQRLGEVLADHRALRLELGLAREHDVEAARQRAARQALPGLAAHDHRLAEGQRAEAAQVGRRAARAGRRRGR